MKTRVDQTALAVNQAAIIMLLVTALLADWPWLAALVAAVMAIGTIWPQAGLFKLIYFRALKPWGVLQPRIIADDPASHLFAQGVGALVLGLAGLAFVGGFPLAGWLLVGLVIILAGINLFFGFCLGCFLYYQLAQRGVPFIPVRVKGKEPRS
ncbi:MAG: DUF4395 family protein [Caldilineaceae bacterium]|nr:DUF4395 family protein [Caldilineaceae bacterium]